MFVRLSFSQTSFSVASLWPNPTVAQGFMRRERERERVLVGKREEEREAERVTGERVSLCAWLKVECLRKPNCSLPIEGTHCQFEN